MYNIYINYDTAVYVFLTFFFFLKILLVGGVTIYTHHIIKIITSLLYQVSHSIIIIIEF